MDVVGREDALRLAANVFCPTGEGGGVDPSCSPGEGGGGDDREARQEAEVGRLWDRHDRELDRTEKHWRAEDKRVRKDRDREDRARERQEDREDAKARAAIERKASRELHAMEREFDARHKRAATDDERAKLKGEEEARFQDLSRRERADLDAYQERVTTVRDAEDSARSRRRDADDAAREADRERFRRRLEDRYAALETRLRQRHFDEDEGPTENQRFVARTDPEKIREFKAWLDRQFAAELTGRGDEELWQRFVAEGLRKGAGRAFDDARRAARAVATGDPEKTAALDAGRDEFLRSSFNQPVATQKVKLIAGRALNELEGVTAEMATTMTRVLADGLARGASPRDIARDLAKRVDVGQVRALRIARYEIARAHAEGQLDALEAMGVGEVGVEVEWTASGLGTTAKGYPSPCPKCAPFAGQSFTIAEARGRLPLHPNAVFAGSTFASYGECKELVRAWYRGPSVVLALRGRKDRPTIGPNHPVMTRRGMVCAAELREGDEVLRDRRIDRDPVGGDLKQVPVIEDVFSSSVLVRGRSGIVPSTSDLHGDVVFCQGEVEGIRPAGRLLVVLDSFGVEQFRKDDLARTDPRLAFVTRASASRQNFGGVRLSSACGVCGGDVPQSGFRRSPGVANALALASIPGVASSLEKSAIHGVSIAAELPSDGVGTQSGVEQPHDLLDADGKSVFEWVEISHVQRSEFEGWAFDATTASSLYCSSALVVSNCLCVWRPNLAKVEGFGG